MLLVRTIGVGVAAYFTDGRDPGRWSTGATRLIGLQGPVSGRDLVAVLRGRHPGTGGYLPAVRSPRRRAGWDLIFAAPKSVSLLAATGPAAPAPGATVAGAHRAAVDGVLAWLEQRLTVAHRADAPDCGAGADAPGDRPFTRADGLVAASFTHHHNAASEPHLHTHVLVANLTRAGDRWWAVRGEDWFVNRAALGALYQLGLRHHLRAGGWELDWRLRPDGLADLADVPRAAVRAASSQSGAVATHGRFEARRRAVAVPWRERAAGAGFTGRVPAAIEGEPAARPPAAGDPLADAGLERAVTARLGAARSDFRRADVVVALAACHPGGATVEAVDGFVDRICASSRPVASPTRGARWSTPGAARLDDRLVRLLGEMAERPGRAPAPDPGPGIDRAVAERSLGPEAARAARRIVATRAGVVHLGAPVGTGALLAQAEILDACRDALVATGLTTAVDAAVDAAPRWALLSGLDPHRPGQPADVVVVDRADRRSTSELLGLAEAAHSAKTRLVLVHGGTMPRLSAPHSRGLAEAAVAAGYLQPGPHRPWGPPDRPGPEMSPGGPGRLTGREAAAAVLDRWRRASGPEGSLLVGLGLDEVIGLNRAARRLAGTAAGPDRDPQRQGRPAAPLGPGDRVVVLHRRGGPAPYGSFGEIRPGPAGPVVHWDGGLLPPAPLDSRLRRGLRPGWAVTPFLAGRSGRPLAVLGPATAAGVTRDRILASIDRPATDVARSLGR